MTRILLNSPSLGHEGGPLVGAMRRSVAPHWRALLALALFLTAGLAVLDDYGVTTDEDFHRTVFLAQFMRIQGHDAEIPREQHHKFYGLVFQAPLVAAERAFGLEEGRGVYLARHLITHLFYLIGGLFAYLLAQRLLRNRLLALFAMLIFLLHPRLYAHSFVNAFDIPFLVLFIIALYKTHSAFRTNTVSVFILLGAIAGSLVALRILGVIIIAMILAIRAIDLAMAERWGDRKRVILTTASFALSAALTVYALTPYLWADPIPRAIEWWATLSTHPYMPYELFSGTVYHSVDFPNAYLPVWISITSPLFYLLLGSIGAAAILAWAIESPRKTLKNTRLRFALALLGCFASPIAGVILLDANIYSGWRHLYFVWAPFSLVAVFGMRWLSSALKQARLLEMAGVAAVLGLAATVISMALAHPNEQVFFNALVDRVTPEHLRKQYLMDYWDHPTRQALEWLADQSSASSPANISGDGSVAANLSILPNGARRKLALSPGIAALTVGGAIGDRPDLALRQIKIYDNTLLTIEQKADLRAIYEDTLRLDPILDSAYDAYRLDGALALVMDPCSAPFITETSLRLRIVPVDNNDLPYWMRSRGFETPYYPLIVFGALFDGKCVAAVPLPNYPIAEIDLSWEPQLLNDGEAREAARSAVREQPLARSDYDIYLADGILTYIKEPCGPADSERPFYLDLFPESVNDLPRRSQGRGFERLYYQFHRNGALLDDSCVMLLSLPDYPVAAVRTGQRAQNESDVWTAQFSLQPGLRRAAYRSVASTEPLVRSVYDLYLENGSLVYVKERCEPADRTGRFFLHIFPDRMSDLPPERQEHGFDNLDFDFFLNGSLLDGKCVAVAPLPDYSIDRARTGQFISGEGEVWSEEVVF